MQPPDPRNEVRPGAIGTGAQDNLDRYHTIPSHSTAFYRVTGALESHGWTVRHRGQHADAQCPAHGSRSLKLRVFAHDDSAGLHCVSMDCAAADVLAAIGLELRDLYDGDRPPGYVPPPRRDPSPWDAFTAPGIDHVLARMVREKALEDDPGLRHRARAAGDDCAACATGVAR